jgi:PAS domain S-box-containing protein
MKSELHDESVLTARSRPSARDGSPLDLPHRFIELLPVAIYACDASGRVVWFNKLAADLWGRTPRIGDDSELFCGSHRLWLGGRQIGRSEMPMAEALRSGEAIHGVEVLIERPDGSGVWATVHIDPIRDASGEIIGAINCFTDTTVLHQARSELLERDAHTRHLLEAIPVAIYTTDAAGRLTYFNGAAAEFAGRTPRLGKDKWCVSWKLYNADGSEMRHDECPMARALREDRAFDDEVIEAIAERPDGTRRWFTPYPTPLHDRQGKLIGGVNILLDITRRKRNELLLAEQGAMLELTAKGRGLPECLKALTASVARLDPDSRACVLLADANGKAFVEAYSTSLPDTFGNNLHTTRPGHCGLTVGHREPITCRDVQHDLHCAQGWRDLCLAHGIRALHSAPILDEHGNGIGSFLLAFARSGEPSEWHLRLARFGAHVASITIAKSRAELAAREGAVQLAEDLADAHLLQGISTEMLSETSRDALYARIVDAAAAVMRSDFASLQMFHPEAGGELRLLAHRGFDERSARTWDRVHAGDGTICAAAVQEGRRIIASDVRHCAVGLAKARLADYDQAGIRSVQSTPLFARNGKLVGMLSTHWRAPHEPPARRLGLLDVLCRQAADLIENRRAEQALVEANVSLERRVSERTAELEGSERELRRVASMLSMAEHAERRRISQILHDDLQQQLHSIQMKMAAARAAIERGDHAAGMRHLETAEAWCGEGVEITRRLTVDLSPPILKSEGLAESLDWLVSQMRAMHGLDVDVTGDRELPMPDDATRVLIYQIVRELLFNIVKHAGTDHGHIELHQQDDRLDVCVSDEGHGFDPAAMRWPRTGRVGGFGIASAGERLAMLGGALEIDSSPKSGTRVVLHVPTSARPDRPGAAPPPGFGGDPTSFSPADAGRG